MPIDLHHFWGSNYYSHPPLTTEMVRHAEQVLGVTLPAGLIKLLEVQNGGYTQGCAHPMSRHTTWAENHVPLEELAGIVIDPNHRTVQNLLLTECMTQEWGLPEKQVILSGDGHYWITLDYRAGPNPSVAWIDVECGEDMQIASSFDEFLSGLFPHRRTTRAESVKRRLGASPPRSSPSKRGRGLQTP